jgi:hypothetical protein
MPQLYLSSVLDNGDKVDILCHNARDDRNTGGMAQAKSDCRCMLPGHWMCHFWGICGRTFPGQPSLCCTRGLGHGGRLRRGRRLGQTSVQVGVSSALRVTSNDGRACQRMCCCMGFVQQCAHQGQLPLSEPQRPLTPMARHLWQDLSWPAITVSRSRTWSCQPPAVRPPVGQIWHHRRRAGT